MDNFETAEAKQTRINNKQGIIYRFEVYNFHYVGQSKLSMEERFKQHKRSCLGLDEKHIDNSRKYVIMRELGINADNFDDLVKCRVIKTCRLEEIDYFENLNITIGEFSLNHQHSLYYLDGYYTKDYKEYGTYTAEEAKARNLNCAKLRIKRFYNNEEGKAYTINFNRKSKIHICECCNSKAMRPFGYKQHLKTLKHSYNKLMWID